jgi:hypothetical protein
MSSNITTPYTSNTTLGVLTVQYQGSANNALAIGANAYNSTTGTLLTMGVRGLGTGTGVQGIGINGNTTASSGTKGVLGVAYDDDAFALGVQGAAFDFTTGGTSLRECYGVYGQASDGSNANYAGYGTTTATGSTDYAGYFVGNLYATSASSSVKAFKIDHPTDPDNKYLYHSSVESNEMLNVYSGNITTNAAGVATVKLPAYFEALNQDFRYQLTVIGSFAQAIISKEVADNRFEIKTNQPNVKVSWQVSGVRHDAVANANRIVDEVAKEKQNVGKYLNPKALGKPMEQQIGRNDKIGARREHIEPNNSNKQ